MNPTVIFNGFKAFAKTAGMTIERKLPELLLGGSIIAGALTVYEASKATLKAQPIIQKYKDDLETINTEFEEGSYERKAATKHATIDVTKKLAKNYALPIVTGTLSLTFSLTGFGVLKGRYLGATAAASAIHGAYMDYRARIAQEIGEERENDIYYRVGTEKVETVGEDGKKKKKQEKIFYEGMDRDAMDEEFGRYFDSTCTNWKSDPLLCKNELVMAQCWLENKLASRPTNKPVFVNEFYSDMNMKLSKKGWKWGWDHNDLGKVSIGVEEGYLKAIRESGADYIPTIRVLPNCHPLNGWC